MAADPLADVLALGDIYEAGLVWQCVCAVARLEIPDQLVNGPLSVPQFAIAVGAHEESAKLCGATCG
jgi:hypothetical protein